MSGKKKTASASAAELAARARGTGLVAQGQELYRPNMTLFANQARVSKADTANAEAALAGKNAVLDDQMTQAVLAGRGGKGLGGATRLALASAPAVIGAAKSADVVASRAALRSADLKGLGAVTELATGGFGDAVSTQNAGGQAQAGAELSSRIAHNLKAEADQNMQAQLFAAGVKGAGMYAAKRGVDVSGAGDVSYRKGLAGWLAKNGVIDDQTVYDRQLEAMYPGSDVPSGLRRFSSRAGILRAITRGEEP